ncbi:hypothetical protein G3A39_40125 [Paraburkholderia aspalathi]|nr:hypothetical protein [Paraburkholderia aspalathi]
MGINVSRRSLLGVFPFIGAAAVAPVAVSSVMALGTSNIETPEERLDSAFSMLTEAMKEIHGEGVLIKRNEYRSFIVVHPIGRLFTNGRVAAFMRSRSETVARYSGFVGSQSLIIRLMASAFALFRMPQSL